MYIYIPSYYKLSCGLSASSTFAPWQFGLLTLVFLLDSGYDLLWDSLFTVNLQPYIVRDQHTGIGLDMNCTVSSATSGAAAARGISAESDWPNRYQKNSEHGLSHHCAPRVSAICSETHDTNDFQVAYHHSPFQPPTVAPRRHNNENVLRPQSTSL